ncbi:MAG: UDP-glucose 4-epimerase [Candidatus Poriferisodalaceae bacterium]
MKTPRQHVLITGGAGYIGSHVAVDLIEAGHRVTIVDNLCNSSAVSLDRVKTITGTRPAFVDADLRDATAMHALFGAEPIDSVVHCAGLKAVGESVEMPLEYYDNNVGGTFVLLTAMREHGCRNIVFSSSATVYGDPQFQPITEDHPVGATNPYGHTKAQIEQILSDMAVADPNWRVVLLRYFNPVGAHQSGLIGEDPQGTPNNLVPRVLEVASGKWDSITLWGNDWDTPDGTGVRDYIHVLDLAAGHRAAIENLANLEPVTAVNLGTGRGYSVLETITAVRAASGHPVPISEQPRRPGDVASSVADPALALDLLGWKADRDLDEMCRDSWHWRTSNPNGYET